MPNSPVPEDKYNQASAPLVALLLYIPNPRLLSFASIELLELFFTQLSSPIAVANVAAVMLAVKSYPAIVLLVGT